MAKFALIGKNIGYSKSKDIFTKVYHQQYDVFDIDEDKIPETLAYLQKNNYVGVNVTKPYKETICKYIDEITVPNRGVNLIQFSKDGKIHGTSFDGSSMTTDWCHNSLTEFFQEPKSIAILGNGSVVPALLYELTLDYFYRNVTDITVYARKQRDIPYGINVDKKDLSEFKVQNHDLIINTIPFEANFDIDFTCDHKFVYYDLNYADDRLVNKAKKAKNCYKALNGYGMLSENAESTYVSCMPIDELP